MNGLENIKEMISIPTGTIQRFYSGERCRQKCGFQFQQVQFKDAHSRLHASIAINFNSNRYNSKLFFRQKDHHLLNFNSNRYNSKGESIERNRRIFDISIPTGTIQRPVTLLVISMLSKFQFQQVQFKV